MLRSEPSGLSPIGIGSDLAISIRGPAALTGIVGLKATHGRIPYTGHWPEVLNRYFHIGPLARSIRDIAIAFSILQGPDGIDVSTQSLPDLPMRRLPANRSVSDGWSNRASGRWTRKSRLP
jgi:aspartyl-tRNA(Asn)/glutamyl-tRNA(Gln) amidotransferase subunit A